MTFTNATKKFALTLVERPITITGVANLEKWLCNFMLQLFVTVLKSCVIIVAYFWCLFILSQTWSFFSLRCFNVHCLLFLNIFYSDMKNGKETLNQVFWQGFEFVPYLKVHYVSNFTNIREIIAIKNSKKFERICYFYLKINLFLKIESVVNIETVLDFKYFSNSHTLKLVSDQKKPDFYLFLMLYNKKVI